jgi:hypothetical protein
MTSAVETRPNDDLLAYLVTWLLTDFRDETMARPTPAAIIQPPASMQSISI